MKVAAITGYGGRENLVTLDRPGPTPGPDEVLVRVAYAALNRTDVFVRQGLTGPGVSRPVLGVYRAASWPSWGRGGECARDRVAVFPALSCGLCRHCRRGEQNRCADYGLRTARRGRAWGGLQRELIALPATAVLKITGDISLADAAAVPAAASASEMSPVILSTAVAGRAINSRCRPPHARPRRAVRSP